MANNGGAPNPFDTADDVNPFGSDPNVGLEHYDPFEGDTKAPSRGHTPAPADPNSFDFHEMFPNESDNQFSEDLGNQKAFQPQQNLMDAPNYMDQGDSHLVGLEEEEEEEEEEDEEEKESPGVFSLAFYQQLFDVDTVQVLDRIFRSVVPFRLNFFEATSKNPDLYGLIWVSATLVFALASVGNLANYIRTKVICDATEFAFDFNKLPYGALAVFLYVTIVPILLWGALAWIDDFKFGLIQSYCLYGYAMFIFIPAAIACVAPFEISKYISIGIAFGISTLHLVLSMWPILALRRLVQIIATLLMIAAHVGISLSFALYFFQYKAVTCAPPVAPVAPV